MTIVQEIDTVGAIKDARSILLDQHDGAPARLEAVDEFVDLVDRDRGQSQRGLVEHQNLAAAHQAAPDPRHPALAAGQGGSDLPLTFAQFGKQLKYLLQAPAAVG